MSKTDRCLYSYIIVYSSSCLVPLFSAVSYVTLKLNLMPVLNYDRAVAVLFYIFDIHVMKAYGFQVLFLYFLHV